MELRRHPLMRYKGAPNWPPIWTWISGDKDLHPTGEVGTLAVCLLPFQEPCNGCILTIQHLDSRYTSVVLFDDLEFCRTAHRLLATHLGFRIFAIGGLDVEEIL